MSSSKDGCICSTLKIRPLAKLSERKNMIPRFVDTATSLSFKSEPPALFFQNTEATCSYFELAFFDLIEIGHGSFGSVYSATSRADGKRYAVKRSHNAYFSRNGRRRVLHEVEIHESLQPHPNIVDFITAWEERDRLYIQLELCPQKSLHELRRCPVCVSESAVWNWATDMAKALAHLHDNDIIHMDVKPDNMFLTANNVCKLGDFGSAIDLKTDDLDDFDDGDGRYLAPEILNGKPTKAADIYSLGVSLLELASGIDFASAKFDSREEVRATAFAQLKDDDLKQLIKCMTFSTPSLRPTAHCILDLIEHFHTSQ